MKRLLLATSFAAVLALSSSAALAGKGNGGHHDDGHHGHHDNGKHKGWKKRDFRRGERIEVIYLEPRYHIDDYRVYHLAPPPRGHRWVRSDDGKFILVAVATGIIADILLHH